MNPSRTRPLAAAVAISVLVTSLVVPRTSPLMASEPADRYVVVFEGAVPTDLASRVGARGGRVLEVIEQGGFAIVQGLTKSSAQALEVAPDVSIVETDLVLGPAGALSRAADAVAPATADIAIPTSPPSAATYYPRQWNLHAIHAAAAWEDGYLGDPNVRVAVVDTGIDYTHPDLDGRVDLTDDGSVSLLSLSCPGGEPGTPSPTEEITRSQTDGLREFVDYHSHGTAVAGLIGSNGGWLAGVTQRTTLIAVKVHARNRQNCLSVYLAGIYEAVHRKADVIHLSFPLEFNKTQFPGALELINRAMEYAHSNGAVLVAAAGNQAAVVDPASTQFRFCNADHVFCLSATAPTSAASVTGPWTEPDAIWPLTNFGPAIDVAGPGGTATVPNSAVWLHCSTVAVPPLGRPCAVDGRIWSSTGTSFAAAATSGLAAMLTSLRPEMAPDKIEKIIRKTAIDLGTPRRDDFYGDGFIDVERAVARATEPDVAVTVGLDR